MEAEAFWNGHSEKYAAKPVGNPEAYEAKLDLIKRYLHLSDHVLEIGCGTGSTALQLAPYCNHITATDFADGMIDIAKSKKISQGLKNITFTKHDAMAQLQNEAFDTVFAFSLLHLIDDVPSLLRTVRKQLKPNGLFLSKTVCMRDRGLSLQLAVKCISMLPVGPKLNFLSQQQLIRYFKCAGFEVEKIIFFDSQRLDPFIVARRI